MASKNRVVTLREVAERADVHVATVSRALSGDSQRLVKPATVERIQAAAKQLGYRPNTIARSLKTSLSYTVGVLVPDLTNPMFPPIVRGVETVLSGAGYTSLIVNTDNDPEREATAFEELQGRQVDGFIVATARLDDPVLLDAQRDGVRIVLVMRSMDAPNMWSVCADERRGIRLAVDHLVGLGHRRIVHVAGSQDLSNGRDRYQGFVEALTDVGIESAEHQVFFADAFSIEAGHKACAELLERGPFTAVIAGNDLMAIGCQDALQERGLRCPQDVSVVGVNDMPLADRLNPPLTTIRLPQYELGSTAAQLLLGRLAHPHGKPCRQLVAPELVVRGSTAAVNASSA